MGEDIIEAVVQVGADETRYLRCGRGARVLLVLAPDAAERRQLVERFSPEYRVIAPDAASSPALRGLGLETLEAWLQGLIDGLGLESPRLVLSPSAAHLAPRLAAFGGDAAEVQVAVVPPEGS
jgi:hypothetical protein